MRFCADHKQVGHENLVARISSEIGKPPKLQAQIQVKRKTCEEDGKCWRGHAAAPAACARRRG